MPLFIKPHFWNMPFTLEQALILIIKDNVLAMQKTYRDH